MSIASYSIWSTLVLAGILVLIPLSMWLVKKFSTISFRPGATLRIVETLAVGQRERLLVVHTGQQYLLLGATAHQMSLIQELPDYIESESASNFGSILKQVQHDKS